MERRLLKFIMNPAMFSSLFFGILLVINLGVEVWSQGWLQAKLIFVIGLLVTHMAMANWHRNFVNNNNTRSQKFYRIANEVPTVLMIGIIIFVIVQPF
jgi:putative membrane protein